MDVIATLGTALTVIKQLSDVGDDFGTSVNSGHRSEHSFKCKRER